MQADASVTPEYAGTGVGLLIARRFARLTGGDITLVSQLGQGARFTLILSPNPSPVPQPVSAQPAADPSQRGAATRLQAGQSSRNETHRL